MAFMTEHWALDAVAVLSVSLTLFYYYLTSIKSYWSDKHVPHIKPASALRMISSLWNGKKSSHEYLFDIYNQFEGERFCGYDQFGKPMLMIRDPVLIERILVKDFSHFEDRGLPLDAENEPLTVSLVNLKGDQWRSLRHKLIPTFTTGKLRRMVQQICNCGDGLMLEIQRHSETGDVVEIKNLMFSFSSDVIASCAFGLQIKAGSTEGKTFREMVNKALGNSTLTVFRFLMKFQFPKLSTFLRIKSVPSDVHEYFTGLTKATMKHRLENNIKRADFFQMLLTLKEREEANKPSEDHEETIDQDDLPLHQYWDKSQPVDSTLRFTDDLLAAQTFSFLGAGSESVSTTVGVALHYLAEVPETQRRLQTEVDRVLRERQGLWTYDTIKAMTYLDQVIQESLRLFPIGHIHVRQCTRPYLLPGSDVRVDQGVTVIIPVTSIHRDPAHYPEPMRFDPERFRGRNFKPTATYSPFGDGPRMCIGMRFAVMEMKVCIAKIIERYSVKPSLKTLKPLRYHPRALSGQPLGGLWLSFHQRNAAE